ncbi:halo transducer protein [Salinigranum rubrum]|uniref:Halo transducer protein n=1 Tax=Salinigranum rubrum TaxID=755307 RepID=A0A2I8VM64_9EURY|nr:halo transducer protein [Salinigranum rubrum]AUV83027.1 halo transducer protein [Salinigranum rubrum]
MTDDAVDDAFGELSKVVSTPETRTELARIAFEEATETAEPVDHIDVVRARLDRFEERLERIEAHVPELGRELSELVGDSEADLYDTAVGIQRLTTAANRAQGAADELQVDLEEFERWVANPEVRHDEFADELDALDGSLDDLAGAVDAVADARAADGDDAETDTDPAVVWVDTSLRHRAVGLLFADLRTELDALREWPASGDDGTEADRVTELDGRLDDLDARWRALGDRLEGVARPAWHERYDDVLDGFEDAVDDFEPPLDWSEVQATLDAHRGRVDGLA